MRQTYTAIVKYDAGGWVEEVLGVNCQEDTRAKLIESLRVTLAEAIALNRADARGAAGDDFEELAVAR